ncbi:MAG TPA: histidinol dehydrogenase [Candidatus Gracilibacteria bacterium]|nr:histidinol dehydrogenase [Candidatus Gracilibacteria bacterium]
MKILNVAKFGTSEVLAEIDGLRSKNNDVSDVVRAILDDVKKRGDVALFEFSKKFDGIDLDSLSVKREEIDLAYSKIDKDVLSALKSAKQNIEKFHSAVLVRKSKKIVTQAGVKIWREFRPVEKVGLYVPGGRASYPSTVLMLAVPAMIAGCREAVMCTPCDKRGECNPLVLVAADICGVDKIFKIGGAQAVAAMAYGTESIPQVYKIFGPGNQYVTTAKMLVYGDVDIDMPAGPSEILVFADDRANPKFVAADLLSQLEHGAESQAVLVTYSENFVKKVMNEIGNQISGLSRSGIINDSLGKSVAVVVENLDQAVEIINSYAPEHLEIDTIDSEKIVPKIINAGSVFLGKYSSEPLGDYATGANHTLPTSGYAKMFSALSCDSFGKTMQIQKVTKRGFEKLKNTVEILASQEGLTAHKNSIIIRNV